METYFRTVDPAAVTLPELHSYLLNLVAPRPIALASTLNPAGQANLAPFSYFNVFSTHPPILIFSPNRSGRTGLQKDTVLNVETTQEVVVNIVNFSIVEQVNLASIEFAYGVDEFIKSGLTPIPSHKVRPFRVKESVAQLECKVRDVIALGSNPGAGNLVVCEVVWIHIADHVFDNDGKLVAERLDLVARMGYDWYCRADANAMFQIPKAVGSEAIGYDALPEPIRLSKILTGNDLARLGLHKAKPDDNILAQFDAQPPTFPKDEPNFHVWLQQRIRANDIQTAWCAIIRYYVI